jgi:DNA repair protein RadC
MPPRTKIAATQTVEPNGDALIRLALLELENRARRPGALLTNFSVVADWFRLKLTEYEHEVFAAAWLDNRHRLIAFEELFRGTLSATAVPAREVVKAALRHNAAAVLFAHNHPSGCGTPSGDDLALTLELGRALDLVDVGVLDHFVVTAVEPPQSVWPTALLNVGCRRQPTARKSKAVPKTARALRKSRG